ncbi:MAG: diguanylate cyclase [Clostridium beijerinckii]|jgi:diguanylate cyclase|nr:diguanylate cyclase [Clostridium beijerinckii]MCI1577534.1 diguanylate cyclase [Clostridium beijerinckii]MCI1585985.1 diguanylate cyclase [Clostridium beijerinckii]MCI1621207.1 diguanylate cyclase [Clostridium beijerinckii]
MLKLLFANAAMLISFLYLGSQMLNDEFIKSNSKIKVKLCFGILSGLSGCILIFYGINLTQNTIIDFRIIPVIIASIYGGFIPTFISVFIIILFRLIFFEISFSSLITSANLFILLIIFTIISRYKINFSKKYFLMTIVNIISTIIWISLVLKDMNLILPALGNFVISIIMVSTVVYYELNYISKTNKMYKKLKVDSRKDFLTGLNNVRAFNGILDKTIRNTLQKKENLSILMIDIDFFKHINDTYGHHSGDLVLKQLSKILIDSCRTFDVISRNGGEEFTAVLLDCNYKHAVDIAEKIRKNVECNTFKLDNNATAKITVSIGISSYPDITKNINTLLSKADNALYLAKRTGRNKVC